MLETHDYEIASGGFISILLAAITGEKHTIVKKLMEIKKSKLTPDILWVARFSTPEIKKIFSGYYPKFLEMDGNELCKKYFPNYLRFTEYCGSNVNLTTLIENRISYGDKHFLKCKGFTSFIDPNGLKWYSSRELIYLVLEPGKKFIFRDQLVECDFLISGFRRNLASMIVKHELCRSVCHWPLYKIKDISDKIPAEVAVFLASVDTSTEKTNTLVETGTSTGGVHREGNFVLAGGVLTNILMNLSIKRCDYDIFYVGSALGLAEKLNEIRKNNSYIETENSITIVVNGYKIQFIKRVYSQVNHIVGGFDLDPCRLILLGNTVWGTYSAKWSIEMGFNNINEKCASETFIKRIKKYYFKGFTPAYYKSENYKFAYRGTQLGRGYDTILCGGLTEENLKIYTLGCILYAPDKLFIKNRKYSLEELKEIKELDYFLEKRLEENYKKYYKNLTACRISNPTTQFTGSFFPTAMDLSEHAKKPIKYSLSSVFPYMAYMALKTRFYPKLVKYILCFISL
jgi:hypothetical protein